MIALDERFLMENNRSRNEVQRKIDIQEDEDEETLTYAPARKSSFINDEKGVFSSSVFDESKSINKAPSIFDATALFKTNGE